MVDAYIGMLKVFWELFFFYSKSKKKHKYSTQPRKPSKKKIQNMEKIFADQTSNKYIESKNPRFTRNPYNSKRANK